MSEAANEAMRHQAFMRVMRLVFAGEGHCPGCQQQKAIFARRNAMPGSTKERCLDCWKAER